MYIIYIIYIILYYIILYYIYIYMDEFSKLFIQLIHLYINQPFRMILLQFSSFQ